MSLLWNKVFNEGWYVIVQETDYIMSYFDNGEEFGGDSDDNMEEAIYWNSSSQHRRDGGCSWLFVCPVVEKLNSLCLLLWLNLSQVLVHFNK